MSSTPSRRRSTTTSNRPRSTGRSGGAIQFISLDLPPRAPAAQPFRADVKQRNDENSDHGGRNHAAEHGRTHGVARQRTRSRRDDQRQQSENEGKARHHHRPEP